MASPIRGSPGQPKRSPSPKSPGSSGSRVSKPARKSGKGKKTLKLHGPRRPSPPRSPPREPDIIHNPLFCAPQGLPNPGNYCYRRSVLQALLHVPALLERLWQPHPRRGCGVFGELQEDCSLCALQALALNYFPPFDVGHLEDMVEKLDDTFDRDVRARAARLNQALSDTELELLSTEQNDADEFFRKLVEDLVTADEARASSSPLLTLQTTATSHCPVCGTGKHRHDSALGMVLSFDGVDREMSLSDLIAKNWTSALVMRCYSAVCAPHPDPAPERSRLETTTAQSAPRVLYIQLSRFDMDWVVSPPEPLKLTHRIAFEESLQLSAANATGEQRAVEYKLHSVVAHSGDDAKGGHYIAAVRDMDDSGSGWSYANDEYVRERDGTDDLTWPQYYDENDMFEPYMLFYQRLDPEPQADQQPQAEGAES